MKISLYPTIEHRHSKLVENLIQPQVLVLKAFEISTLSEETKLLFSNFDEKHDVDSKVILR